MPHAQYGVDLSKVPDTYIEPFTAYRAWNWTAEGITSLNGVLWTPKKAFEATCRLMTDPPMTMTADGPTWQNQHQVPDPGCTCGMYAGINMQHLIDIGYIERGLHGEVSLWGRLYRHTLGWRAQFAYPKYFVVPVNMIPFDMAEAQCRLDQLTEFGVDIYIQKEREAHIGQEKLPLYIQEYGYSAQGLEYLVEKRQRWYSGEGQFIPELKVGDRLAVYTTLASGSGIGIIHEIKGGDVYYKLFAPDVIYHKPVKDLKWSQRNWRWETTGLGASRSIR